MASRGSSASQSARARSSSFRLAFGLARHPLVRVVARRLGLAIPLLFIVSALSFVLLSLVPGNAALQILGVQATRATIAATERQLGLNLPLYEQYWRWLSRALHGNLGNSLYTGVSVSHSIIQRLPVSLSLIVGGLIVMPAVGVTMGVYSAVRGGVAGRFVDGFALVAFAVPSFWLGAILVELFAVKVHWFPAVGYVSLWTSPAEWLRSITLPVIALSMGGIAGFAKYTREAMLEVLASEHIRMAWADGVPARHIFFRYALKNAGVRVITLVGLLTIGLLGGTAFIETIFALPGIGSLVVTSASEQDVPMVQGVTVFFTLIIIVVNLVTDLAYTLLDPRVRSA